MKFKLVTISQVCKNLQWGVTKYYERKNSGLFPKPVNISGKKKGNVYFSHEIDFYVIRAMNIKDDNGFRALALEIEDKRKELNHEAA